MNAFRTPLVRAKLQALWGQKAEGPGEEIESRPVMKGFEDTYGPRSNSVTSTINAEIANQDELSAMQLSWGWRPIARRPRRARRARSPRPRPTWPARAWRSCARWACRKQVRNEAGYMLAGSPAELAHVLEQLNRKGRRTARRRGARLRRGLIGAGVAAHTAPDRSPGPRTTQKLTGRR
jgi:hypothetical protein